MKFRLAKDLDFVPVWQGNNKQDEPITFRLRYITVPERDELLAPAFEDGKVTIKPNYPKAFRLGVAGISGLNVDGADISDAQAFLRLPASFHELMLEVASKVLSMNAETDLKNLP